MSLEIERKFLVRPGYDIAALATESTFIGQKYLSDNPDATVRVRIAGNRAMLTVKSRNCGAVRCEWEYEIPVEDAEAMMDIAGLPGIVKTRYYVPFEGHTWEVDVFHGPLEGLVLAEVELADENENVILPAFVDREVTGDPAYYNSVLARSHN